MEWRRLEQKPDLWQPRTEQCAHKSSVKTWMQFKPTEWAIAGVLASSPRPGEQKSKNLLAQWSIQNLTLSDGAPRLKSKWRKEAGTDRIVSHRIKSDGIVGRWEGLPMILARRTRISSDRLHNCRIRRPISIHIPISILCGVWWKLIWQKYVEKIMKCIFLSVATAPHRHCLVAKVASIKRKRQTEPHAATCAAQ